MNGLAMNAGVEGFMQGFRFGREMMGDDPESRKLRAEQEVAHSKGLADQRKNAMDQARFGLDIQKEQNDEAQRVRDNEFKRADDLRADQNLGLTRDRTRATVSREARESAKAADEQNFQDIARQQRTAFSTVLSDPQNATPAQWSVFNKLAPWYAQDAQATLGRFSDVLSRAQQKYQAGDVRGADSEFSTPEGRQALNDAAGPFITQQKGMALDPEGKYVVGDTQAAGLIRDAKTNDLAMQLQVTRVPSPQYAEQLRQEYERANPQRKREIEAELQPKAYTTMLTDGRVPLDQGGQVKWFKPQEFQSFVGGLNRLAYLQQQHPEMFDDVRRYLDSNVASKNEQEGTKLYLQRSDAAAKDSEVRAEQRRDNARQDQKVLIAGVDKALSTIMPGWQEGDTVTDKEGNPIGESPAALKRIRISHLRTKAYDAILTGKAKSSEEAIQIAEKEYPPPMAERMSSILSGNPLAPEAAPTNDFPPTVREIGERFRRGEISEEQARQELKKWGYN